MITVSRDRTICVPASEVWRLLREFSDISWAGEMGRVECEGSGVGMIRRIFVTEESPAEERLDALDDNNMSFDYSVLRGLPMPVKNYTAKVSVSHLDSSKSLVAWNGSMDSDGVTDKEAEAIVGGFYDMLLEKLESYFMASSS